MDLGLTGRTALVLGGSKGIGRATCRELALAGANIAVVARTRSAIDEAVEEMRGIGVRAIGISADLFDIGSYEKVVATCTAELAAPDIAIYNLDPPPPGTFAEVDEEQLAEAFRIVVLNYSRMLRLVLPHMQKQKWGRVVTIGSGAAKQLVRSSLNFGYVLANATRVAAAALAKTVAAEVARDGITINTIGTGLIESGQSTAWIQARADEHGISGAEFAAGMVSHIPMGRKGRPEEMAALAVYLCSERASYTTGETILCDGGMCNSIL
jgi:3-oxoacyl-[acyl-carrier protein] reductase